MKYIVILLILSACHKTQLQKCEETFEFMKDVKNDPELLALLKRENKLFNKVFQDRCNYWISNGQEF